MLRQLCVAQILATFILILLPSIADARLVVQPYVPTSEWPYGVCDYMVEQGIVTGYADNFFDGTEPREWREFAEFVIMLIPLLHAAQERSDPSLADIDVDELVLRLVTYFSQTLKITSVEFGDSSPVFATKFNEYLRYTGGSFTAADLKKLLDEKSASDKMSLPSAYDEVPLTSTAYENLALLAREGILEGYPEDFFTCGRVMTRYEFAQAIALSGRPAQRGSDS